MKVAFIIRSTARNGVGGDATQCRETARELRLLGVSVDEYFADDVIQYEQYDLLHFFNLVRPADILVHIMKCTTPFVVSTIFVEFRSGARRPDWFLDLVELLKYVARLLLRIESRVCWRYLHWGHKASIKYIARRAAALLPNSKSEAERLRRYVDGSLDGQILVVPNGVATEKFNAAVADKEFENAVVCAGLIQPLKNQLRVLRAMRTLPYNAFIVGGFSKNRSYRKRCLEECPPNVHFLGAVSQNRLAEILKAAKVHVLASFFETTGLVSLEAAYCGCNIVTTLCGDQREYFEGVSYNCDPLSVESIRQAIQRAHEDPRGILGATQRVTEMFTWRAAALVTIESYRSLVNA